LNRARGHVVLAVAAAGAALLACPAAALDVPYLAGRVNDTAGMLSGDERAKVETALATLERDTGAQVAVLTIPTLAGESLDDYSMRVAQTWKLGRKGHDDGVLFLIARDDRKMRLEVGYGLEGKLPDALCGRILDNLVRPEFRVGRYGAGIERAIGAVSAAIAGKAVKAEPPAGSARRGSFGWAAILPMSIFLLVMIPFAVVTIFGKGCQTWFLFLFLIPFWGAFPAGFIRPIVGLVTVTIWIVLVPIAKLWLGKTSGGKAFLKTHTALATFATSSGHSGSGGGWSSGGFSGGGGSFGGGGASSSW
jgi:uncharacterized protein